MWTQVQCKLKSEGEVEYKENLHESSWTAVGHVWTQVQLKQTREELEWKKVNALIEFDLALEQSFASSTAIKNITNSLLQYCEFSFSCYVRIRTKFSSRKKLTIK